MQLLLLYVQKDLAYWTYSSVVGYRGLIGGVEIYVNGWKEKEENFINNGGKTTLREAAKTAFL